MHSAPKWQTLEGTLNQDMATLLTYLLKWKLKLIITKEARYELKLPSNEGPCPFVLNLLI